MLPARWQQISDKLYQAMHLDAKHRGLLLEQVGSSDPEMRRELETLLKAHEEAESTFLPESDGSSDRIRASQLTIEVIGQRFGDYRIVEQIGEGGMGDVYRAVRDDEQYQQQVAIKLVRSGLDSALVLRRFKNERQILANLNHPNIGRLLDGGMTDRGVPFLVMELVDGKPIDQHCKGCNLSVRQRLELFLQVCSAVQFAHQRLIIHRDIKPGNILVTSNGVPKLLDFGIAKILERSELGGFEPTITVFRALTPAYASPEQVKCEPITTSSDVYSLGVVLYELLTGQHPHRRSDVSLEEVARAVCDIEPEKPSTAVRWQPTRRSRQGSHSIAETGKRSEETDRMISKRLRGDLDNIVLMALRKEPQRRYASVEQFAADIRRHLDNLPVFARKDTPRYRASKFVRRHKAGVTAAAAVVVTLIAALIITLHEARVAHLQQERAERRFNDVRKLANSLMFEIHDSIRDLPGATKTRELLVKRALEYLDSLSRERADPALQREAAAAYERIGDVQGNNMIANLNDFSGATASYTKALTIRESLAAANPKDLNLRTELLQAYFKAFAAYESAGDFDGDLHILQRARSLAGTLPTNKQQQFNMSGIYYYTGRAFEKSGRFPAALESYQKAALLMEPIGTAPQASATVRTYLAGQQIGIAKMLAELGRTSEAVAIASKGLATIRKLSADEPTNATLREQLAVCYNLCADVLESNRDREGALRILRLSRKIYQDLGSVDPGNRMAKADLAWSDLDIAEVMLRQGKVNAALPLIREALPIFQKAVPANTYWYAVSMAETYTDLGKVNAIFAEHASSRAAKRRFWIEASALYQQALEVRGTGPGRRDGNGHDQIGDIHRQLATATTALAQLENRVALR